MISRVESVQNWLENITYQMNNMVKPSLAILIEYLISFSQSYKEQSSRLAGYVTNLTIHDSSTNGSICAAQSAS